MRHDGQAVNLSNLTPGERAILELLTSQPGGGVGLLSRAWFQFCVRNPDPKERPNFPTTERVLSRDLARLVKWRLFVRVVAPDHGAWYCLPEVWAAMTPHAKLEVRSFPMNARGGKTMISLLLPGPAGISPTLRDKIWAAFQEGDSLKYRGTPFKDVRDPETGTVHPYLTPIADPGIRLYALQFTTELTGRPIRFEHVA
jgi:hypothetical protein